MDISNIDWSKRYFSRSKAYALGRLSCIAYQTDVAGIDYDTEVSAWNFDTAQKHFVNVNFLGYNTQAYIFANDKGIFLAFRGTQELEDWGADLQSAEAPGAVYGLWTLCTVHLGFADALQTVWNQLFNSINKLRSGTPDKPLWITGHSLGGALALLAAAKFLHKHKSVSGVYNFGQPKVGNFVFCDHIDERLRFYRYVNHNDAVPGLPPVEFKHCGVIRYFDSQGVLQSNETDRSILSTSFQDHHMENYLQRLEEAGPDLGYLGNQRTLEFHDLENPNRNCQTDEIDPDHIKMFPSPEDAVAAGFDYCAWCFSRGMSQQ